jgi:hypothetical protein
MEQAFFAMRAGAIYNGRIGINRMKTRFIPGLCALLLLSAAVPALAQQDPYAVRLRNQVNSLQRGWTNDNHPATYEQRQANQDKEDARRQGDTPQTYYSNEQQRFLQQLREQQRVQAGGGSSGGYYNAQ